MCKQSILRFLNCFVDLCWRTHLGTIFRGTIPYWDELSIVIVFWVSRLRSDSGMTNMNPIWHDTTTDFVNFAWWPFPPSLVTLCAHQSAQFFALTISLLSRAVPFLRGTFWTTTSSQKGFCVLRVDERTGSWWVKNQNSTTIYNDVYIYINIYMWV